MLISLKLKGLRKVKLFVSDGFCNIDREITKLFPLSSIGRCFIHFERNIYMLSKNEILKEDAYSFLKEFKKIVYSKDDYKISKDKLKVLIKKHSIFL